MIDYQNDLTFDVLDLIQPLVFTYSEPKPVQKTNDVLPIFNYDIFKEDTPKKRQIIYQPITQPMPTPVQQEPTERTEVPETPIQTSNDTEQPKPKQAVVTKNEKPIQTETVSGNPEIIDKVVNTALAQVNKPFLMEAKGPDKFDCSGLCYYAYKANGIDIPASTAAMLQSNSQEVDLKDVRPGDIIITKSSNRTSGRHARLVYKVENGIIHVVEAKGKKWGVVTSIYKPDNRILSIRRFVSVDKKQYGGTLGITNFHPLTYTHAEQSTEEIKKESIIDLPSAYDPFSKYNFGEEGDIEKIIVQYHPIQQYSAPSKKEKPIEEQTETNTPKVKEKGEKLPGYYTSKKKFAADLLNTYKQVLKEHGLDPEYAYVFTASAVVESGWGKSLSAPYNYGGVMNFTDNNYTISETVNYKNGQDVTEYSKFRNFNSMKDYCNYMVKLMKGKTYKAFERYSPKDPINMWYGVLKSGYGGKDDAHKWNYATEVGMIINQIKNNKIQD